MNAKLSPHTQILQACDIDEFETRARDARVHLLVTQLEPGRAQVRYRTRMLGDAVLSAYRVLHALAVDWVPRPCSLNFSIQTGRSGMLFGGRERPPSSVIVYVEPAASNWTGVIPAEEGTGAEAIHISVPLESAASFEVEQKHLSRGLLHMPIGADRAQAFARWADRCFADSTIGPDENDETFAWLCEFLEPIRRSNNDMESPSHYDRMIREVNRIADQSPGETPAVLALATSLRVSVRTLQRAFHATFGVGVERYLRNRRLRAAHELLRSGQCAVAQAAICHRFLSRGAFCAAIS